VIHNTGWLRIELLSNEILEIKLFIMFILGDSAFDFTSLLHTYFKLDSIDNAKVYGLSNCNYSDKVLKNFTTKK